MLRKVLSQKRVKGKRPVAEELAENLSALTAAMMSLLMNVDFDPETELRPDGKTSMTAESLVGVIQRTSEELQTHFELGRPRLCVSDKLAEKYERILRGNIVWNET